MSCPSPADVERAYWTRDAALSEHVNDCDACRDAWTEIEELAALGAKIEPPAWTRQEDVRTTLLSKVDGITPAPAPWRRVWLAAPALAAAAAAIVLFIMSREVPGAKPVQRRTTVLEHPGARSMVVAEQPDEIVRLVDGTLTVTVAALGPNERVRVITGDDQIEAPGAAAFDVTAERDRVTVVRVLHGQVKLLAANESKTLNAGEMWHAAVQTAEVIVDAAAPTPTPTPQVVVEAPRAEVLAPAPKPAKPVEPEPVTVSPEPAVDAAPVAIEPTPVAPLPARSMAQQAFDEGWTALRAGDYATAAKAFERTLAVSSEPHVIEDATFWRGVALARNGEVVTAVHVLTAFVRAYPSSPRAGEANVMMGWMLFERGDRDDAKRAFEAAQQDSVAKVRDSARKGLAEIAKRSK